MTDVVRYDRAEFRLDRAERLDNGWLRVEASIGRVGVLEYHEADGTVRREYRPPEEVFHADALRTAEMRPVTNNHPPEPLNVTNTRHYQVGQSGSSPRRDGDFVISDIMITDSAARQAVDQGRRQLSPGYVVELDKTPGQTPSGERYDAVQRKIRINHFALVDAGRQGDGVALRMDSGDAIEASLATPQAKETTMKTIRLDGKDYEIPDEVAAAYETASAELAKLKERKDDASDKPPEVAKLQARVDALEEQRAAEKKARDEERADEQRRIDQRVAIVSNAKRIIGDDYRADGKSDLDVMSAVVLHLDSNAKDKLEARKDDRGYIEGRYEVALEQAAERRDSGSRLLDLARSASGKEEKSKLDENRERFDADRQDAWKGQKTAG